MSSPKEKKSRGRPRKTKPVEEQLAEMRESVEVKQNLWQRFMSWLKT